MPITPTTGPTTPAVRQLRSAPGYLATGSGNTPAPRAASVHQLTAKSDRAGGDKRRVECPQAALISWRVAILSVQSSTTRPVQPHLLTPHPLTVVVMLSLNVGIQLCQSLLADLRFRATISSVVKRICRCRLLKCTSSHLPVPASRRQRPPGTAQQVYQPAQTDNQHLAVEQFLLPVRAISSSRIWRL